MLTRSGRSLEDLERRKRIETQRELQDARGCIWREHGGWRARGLGDGDKGGDEDELEGDNQMGLGGEGMYGLAVDGEVVVAPEDI